MTGQVEVRPPVLTGEVQVRRGDPDTCPIRQWQQPGPLPYAWSCTVGAHSGRGSHRTPAGRDAGIEQHRALADAARAAGHTGTWETV